MKKIIILLAIFNYLNFSLSQENHTPLFRIYENGLYGYIDSTGRIVIPPKYKGAGEFSEGLAPVRQNGLYGYINTLDEMIILPQFEYAEPFFEDAAIVYNNGSPLYINKFGKQMFDCSGYKKITNFINGRAFVYTKSKKNGVVSKNGKLIIDTIYFSITPFNDGVAVVQKINPDSTKSNLYGVVDTNGNIIVTLGKYSRIENYYNGFAYVSKRENNEQKTEGFIDSKGNLLFLFQASENSIYGVKPYVSDSIIICEFKKQKIDTEPQLYQTASYYGIMDINGKVIYTGPEYDYILDFNEGRSFARKKNKYYLIDKSGRIISNKKFDYVGEPKFRNGICFVRSKNKWGIIDRNGNFVLKPKYKEIDKYTTFDDFFMFYEVNKGYGISDFSGNIIVEPSLDEYDHKLKNGILRVYSSKQFGYLKMNGKYLWKESNSSILESLDIDYMRIIDFKGLSKELNYSLEFNSSVAKKIEVTDHKFTPNSVSLQISDSTNTKYFEKYYAKKIYIANTTQSPQLFQCQDYTLYLKMQALNNSGQWQDIEYLPSSWCGNSYYEDTLPAMSYWEFVFPVYSGIFKTKVRFKLSGIYNLNSVYDIYSEEFEGNINPAQFWRKSYEQPNRRLNIYDQLYNPLYP